MKIKQEIFKRDCCLWAYICSHSPVNVTSITPVHSNANFYDTSPQAVSLYADFTKRRCDVTDNVTESDTAFELSTREERAMCTILYLL
jgi:hypothetical protein